jgi:hypothetical protein
MKASLIIPVTAVLCSCAPMVPYLQLAEGVEELIVHEISGPQSVPPPSTPGMNGPAKPSAS